jgi:acetyl esterase/lipase
MLLATLLALAPLAPIQQPLDPLIRSKVEQDVQIPMTLPNGQPDTAEFWFQWYTWSGGAPRPLVVAFHGYSSSEASVFNGSQLDLECNKRGWLLLAPLGRFDVDHGSEFGQAHVEACIDWMIANHSVNTDRIYGVGFSNGGGFALSYAARHQDLGKPRFAAVVNHTGVVSQRASYDSSPDCMCCDPGGGDRRSAYRGVIGSQYQALAQFCTGWGGPPAYDYSTTDTPFFYQRASAIDLFFDGTAWVETSDPPMYLNLVHVPVHTYYDPSDSTGNLVAHNQVFAGAMAAAGASHTVTTLSNGGVHAWDALPYSTMMPWLAARTLGLPPTETNIDTAIDQDGWFHYFHVVQQSAGSISWLRWQLRPPGATGHPNSMNFAFGHGTVNVDALTFDWQLAGLDEDQLKIQLAQEASPGLLQQVTLPNYSNPLGVTLFQASGAGSASWQWLPYGNGLGDLVLTRGDASYHVFLIDV